MSRILRDVLEYNKSLSYKGADIYTLYFQYLFRSCCGLKLGNSLGRTAYYNKEYSQVATACWAKLSKMGACVSTGTPEELEQRQRSKAIDLQIRADLKQSENIIKILLLGEL